MKMSLGETVEMMKSDDYKERFVAEYAQLKIRYEKLKTMCFKIRASMSGIHTGYYVEEPKHDCPLDILEEQKNVMWHYLEVLEQRAIVEKIDLEGVY